MCENVYLVSLHDLVFVHVSVCVCVCVSACVRECVLYPPLDMTPTEIEAKALTASVSSQLLSIKVGQTH